MRTSYLTRMTFYLMMLLVLGFTLDLSVATSSAKSSPSQTNKPQSILRVGTMAPAGVSYTKYSMEIEELSDHRIKIELYAGGVLGDELTMVKMVQEGKLDGVLVTTVSLEEIAPETLILSLPYLFRDEYEMDFILEKYEAIFAGYARERGVEILSLFPVGCIQTFSTVPILDHYDLINKKVGSRKKSNFNAALLRSSLFQSLVPLSISEVEPALNSGKVEVILVPPAAAVILGWYPYIRYAVMGCDFIMIAVILVNSDSYQSLPEEVQSTLTTLIHEQRKKIIKRARRDDEIAMLGLMKRGVKIIRWSPEDMEKVREDAKTFWNYSIDKWYPRELLEDIIRDLEAYRATKGREGSK